MMDLVVARNIKSVIEQKGLKQKSVAESAGFSEKKFSDMLNGRIAIKAEDIFKIKDALNISANELFKSD